MNARRPLSALFLAALSFVSASHARAQCTNTAQYPFAIITPNAQGLVTTIEGCNFLTEFSEIGGIAADASYRFTIDQGAYITVHQGTSDGPVLGHGYSPLTVTAATAQDLFAHWTVDSTCATAGTCHATAVQLLPDCTPPEVNVSTTGDCLNNQFSVNVEVVNTGDATTVALSWTVNGGAPNTLAGLEAGSYELGPFANLALIDLTVVHAEDPACNVVVNDITGSPCAIESCGPDTYTHCYGNSETLVQTFVGTSTYPLQLHFNSGNVSASGNDALVIHDGLSGSDPVLFSGVGVGGNLTGVNVISTNPDHALTLTFTSNASFSCADGGVAPEWNYTVGCLDCVPPAGTAGVVTTDCEEQSYTVAVNVTDMGSATELLIGNNAGVPATSATAPGSYVAGPFQVGTAVQLTLVNAESAICAVPLGTFENSYCPVMITCGDPAIQAVYCYTNGDSEHWLYQNTGPESLAMLFSAGSIESVAFDHLTIYDGVDNTAPILYQHTGNITEQLAGLLVISTGPAMYMEMSSDGSVSCSDGQMSSWAWTVGCLDCEQPDASYAVVLDCDSGQFYIATTIEALGSDSTITITNTGGAPPVEVTEAGTYSSGPFALGADVQVTLVVENALCSVHSPVLTSAPCPLIGCGPYQFDLCYPDNMDTTIVYQSPGPYPIALLFNSGVLDAFGDLIQVYDGLDYQAPLVFSGNNDGDLSGLQFTSTNPDNALCVRFFSNGFTSCVDNGTTPWNWSVSCLDCTNPEATFELVPDCLHHGFGVAVNVSSLGSATDLRIANSWSADTVASVGLGTTIIGPIPVGVTTHLTVMNGANPLCRIISADFTLPADECVTTACEPLGVDYCYADNDTAWFVYQSGENTPITISFAAGQLLDNDEIWLYNGLDQSAQLVFAGNLGGDVAGLALSSSNPDNALTMLVISDGEGSCATGQASPNLYWTVGCGLVGQVEEAGNGFSLFPNPTTGALHVRPLGSMSGAVYLEVLDVTGRRVMDERFSAAPGITNAFDLGGLNNGYYAVRLSTRDGSTTTQVQVVR